MSEIKNYFFNLSFFSSRLEKTRANNNPWVDDIKYDLCRILYDRRNLVTIFQFDSEQYHGCLEDAILEALLNGNFSLLAQAIIVLNLIRCQIY